MGLLMPHVRHGRRDGQADLSAEAPSPASPRLVVLVAAEDGAALAALDGAFGRHEIASVIVQTDASRPDAAATARALVAAGQQRGVAMLAADHFDLARDIAADGVHLSSCDMDGQAARAARKALGPGFIVGVDCGLSRHKAMSAAENGADYVLLGGDHEIGQIEAMVRWWAELMETPCAATAHTHEEAALLLAAGADFIAMTARSLSAADRREQDG
jgi:thiamine-phosphate pyrophosphorylase